MARCQAVHEVTGSAVRFDARTPGAEQGVFSLTLNQLVMYHILATVDLTPLVSAVDEVAAKIVAAGAVVIGLSVGCKGVFFSAEYLWQRYKEFAASSSCREEQREAGEDWDAHGSSIDGYTKEEIDDRIPY